MFSPRRGQRPATPGTPSTPTRSVSFPLFTNPFPFKDPQQSGKTDSTSASAEEEDVDWWYLSPEGSNRTPFDPIPLPVTTERSLRSLLSPSKLSQSLFSPATPFNSPLVLPNGTSDSFSPRHVKKYSYYQKKAGVSSHPPIFTPSSHLLSTPSYLLTLLSSTPLLTHPFSLSHTPYPLTPPLAHSTAGAGHDSPYTVQFPYPRPLPVPALHQQATLALSLFLIQGPLFIHARPDNQQKKQ